VSVATPGRSEPVGPALATQSPSEGTAGAFPPAHPASASAAITTAATNPANPALAFIRPVYRRDASARPDRYQFDASRPGLGDHAPVPQLHDAIGESRDGRVVGRDDRRGAGLVDEGGNGVFQA
jgi:hypothetical protein